MDVNTVRAEIEALEEKVCKALKENTLAQQKGDLGAEIVR